MEPTPDQPGPARRRRRAVGPAGARPAEPAGSWPVESDEPPPTDDDARLLADVPPHHGGH